FFSFPLQEFQTNSSVFQILLASGEMASNDVEMTPVESQNEDVGNFSQSVLGFSWNFMEGSCKSKSSSSLLQFLLGNTTKWLKFSVVGITSTVTTQNHNTDIEMVDSFTLTENSSGSIANPCRNSQDTPLFTIIDEDPDVVMAPPDSH
ncbi:hypothetical protein O181_012482, partial [Austropuccinia psidii MF-1]|nr:hypothetical protein [Austropuccinia psidii MF-1]